MGPRVNPQRCLVKAVGICIGSSPTVPSVIFGLDPEIQERDSLGPRVGVRGRRGSYLIAMGPLVKPEDDGIHMKTGFINGVRVFKLNDIRTPIWNPGIPVLLLIP